MNLEDASPVEAGVCVLGSQSYAVLLISGLVLLCDLRLVCLSLVFSPLSM